MIGLQGLRQIEETKIQVCVLAWARLEKESDCRIRFPNEVNPGLDEYLGLGGQLMKPERDVMPLNPNRLFLERRTFEDYLNIPLPFWVRGAGIRQSGRTDVRVVYRDIFIDGHAWEISQAPDGKRKSSIGRALSLERCRYDCCDIVALVTPRRTGNVQENFKVRVDPSPLQRCMLSGREYERVVPLPSTGQVPEIPETPCHSSKPSMWNDSESKRGS